VSALSAAVPALRVRLLIHVVRATPKLAVIVAGSLLIVGAVLCWYFMLHDWDGRPFCHKQFESAFRMWREDHDTDFFPNEGGLSRASMESIHEQMAGVMSWVASYRYIAGLREGDPGDLILMYCYEPTRWTWHGGPPPSVFTKKAWLVVPVDFTYRDVRPGGGGELSERLSPAEFATRLKRTLDFLESNARPHWKVVIQEHSPLLRAQQEALP
jgi:hypothetical protein